MFEGIVLVNQGAELIPQFLFYCVAHVVKRIWLKSLETGLVWICSSSVQDLVVYMRLQTPDIVWELNEVMPEGRNCSKFRLKKKKKECCPL